MEKIDMGFCSKSNMMSLFADKLSKGESIQIHFIDKKSEMSCAITLEIKEPEIRVDEDGSKWKRVG